MAQHMIDSNDYAPFPNPWRVTMQDIGAELRMGINFLVKLRANNGGPIVRKARCITDESMMTLLSYLTSKGIDSNELQDTDYDERCQYQNDLYRVALITCFASGARYELNLTVNKALPGQRTSCIYY